MEMRGNGNSKSNTRTPLMYGLVTQATESGKVAVGGDYTVVTQRAKVVCRHQRGLSGQFSAAAVAAAAAHCATTSDVINE